VHVGEESSSAPLMINRMAERGSKVCVRRRRSSLELEACKVGCSPMVATPASRTLMLNAAIMPKVALP
jgi:hypothetical protein